MASSRTPGACRCASTGAGTDRGAVQRVARPPLAWAFGAGLAVAAGMVLGMLGRRRVAHVLVGALALAVVAISYGESEATGARPWGEIVAALVGVAGLAAAFRLRRDAALEQGVLAIAAILLVLPLIGRLAVLRHGVIVTTLDPDLVRALVVGGLGPPPPRSPLRRARGGRTRRRRSRALGPDAERLAERVQLNPTPSPGPSGARSRPPSAAACRSRCRP